MVVFVIHWHELVTGVHVSPILNPSHPIPLGHPSAPALTTLFHASNLDWWSVSHMTIYKFQSYSLKSSHPRLLPQSPKFYPLYLSSAFWLVVVTWNYLRMLLCTITFSYVYNRHTACFVKIQFHKGLNKEKNVIFSYEIIST